MAILASPSLAQSQDDQLLFGANVDFQIRSDQLNQADTPLAEPDNVLFGYATAATDEILVVGAPWCDERGFDRDNSLYAGAVYVYQKTDQGWAPFPGLDGLPLPGGRDFKLFPSGLQPGDLFGHSVDISKNEDDSHTLVVGAPGTRHATTGQADTGSVYVFQLDAGSYCWQEVPESPLRLPECFNLALPIPEDWEDEDLDTIEWSFPGGTQYMAGIFSIPEERYGESVSIFSGELPRIDGQDVDGVLAIGAPRRSVFAYDKCDVDQDGQFWELLAEPNFGCEVDPDCPESCDFVLGTEEAGAVFVWYRVNGRWVLPNAQSVDCEAGLAPLPSDPPDITKDDDFFNDSRRGRFYSTDLVDFGGFTPEFSEFGHKVQVVVDTEESASDRIPLLLASSLFGRGGSGGVKFIDLVPPDEYEFSDYPFAYDPLASTTFPQVYNSAPFWARRIGFDFDALPLGWGPQPPESGDYQLTVIGMPGNGGQGEALVLTRNEFGGIYSIDRLDRLSTDQGYFPDLYQQGATGGDEEDEGLTAWAQWSTNPQYSGYDPMLFGSTVRFGGVSDDRADFIFVGAPGLTGIKPDADPDDFDFDVLPDPDVNKYSAGGIFVFEYDGIPQGPYLTKYERTGLILAPDPSGDSRIFQRLGESMSRYKLSLDEEDSLGDDINLFFTELTVQKNVPVPFYYRPRPGTVQSLVIDLDDVDDLGDIEDAFESPLSQAIQSTPEDMADRRGFGYDIATSENGNWIAVGSPFSTVPVESESVFVQSSNGTFFMADGAIFESGEVYLFERSTVQDPVSGLRTEVWELRQTIRSPAVGLEPSTSPLGDAAGFIARNAIQERFGFSLDMSPDAQTLLVGAWGGGGRYAADDPFPLRSRGIAYVYHRNSTNDDFEFTRTLAGKSFPNTLQGYSVAVSNDESGSLLVSGGQFYSDTLGRVRTGRVFFANHSNGQFTAPRFVESFDNVGNSQITNEKQFGADVEADIVSGQNRIIASSIGFETRTSTDTELTRGEVEILTGPSRTLLEGVNTSLGFGTSMSLSGDLLGVGSEGTAHLFDIGSFSNIRAGYVFSDVNTFYSNPPYNYSVPFDQGILASSLTPEVSFSFNQLSESISVLDEEGGFVVLGDQGGAGANLTNQRTGSALLFSLNDDVTAPSDWSFSDQPVVLGERKLSGFSQGLAMNLYRRGPQKSQTSVRLYVSGTTGAPGSSSPIEPDCGDLVFDIPRRFESRNQIFMYETNFDDCNENGIPDSSEIASDSSRDCNNDGILDDCQGDIFTDCNENLIPDICEIAGQDCNGNGILDFCDIEDRNVDDVNADGIPDVCQCLGDVNQDGTVNSEDFNQVLAFIQDSGQSDPPCLGCPEDVNNDGLVNILDLNYITTFSGSCP
ncbi:MAG: hypothetical protein CMJ34_06675 [Phycisphaerae bacterium]|nr:hypothetical protein [Phycisphaerae bacterium]